MKHIDYSKLPTIGCPICDSKQFNFFTERPDGGKIVQCLCCGHFYLNPPFNKEMFDEIYREYYPIKESEDGFISKIENWFQDPHERYQAALSWILQHMDLREKKILDIGCGAGRFIAECVKYGADAEGIEPCAKSAELAKRYYNVKITEGYFESLERCGLLKDSYYDMVVLFDLIEHVYRPYDFLKKVSNLLRPRGHLVISTPNFSLFKLFKLRSLISYPEHLHFFEPEGLVKILNKCGFEVLFMTTVNCFSYGARLRRKLSQSKLVKGIWGRVEGNKLIYFLKNSFFLPMDKIRRKEDKAHLAGLTILCIANKTI